MRKANIVALMEFENKINIIKPAYTAKISLKVEKN